MSVSPINVFKGEIKKILQAAFNSASAQAIFYSNAACYSLLLRFYPGFSSQRSQTLGVFVLQEGGGEERNGGGGGGGRIFTLDLQPPPTPLALASQV